ncbi:MAG: hypothetical protein FWH47_06580 [Methanomassiliicoccaceae archaeon]|nr:hypothetical protein [Methanomassiliicoccaceae archaeon]
MNDRKVIDRPDAGTLVCGIDRAIVSCRKHKVISVAPQTGTHRASMISCTGNVVIEVRKPYTVAGSNG